MANDHTTSMLLLSDGDGHRLRVPRRMKTSFDLTEPAVEHLWGCKTCQKPLDASQLRSLVVCSSCKIAYYCHNTCQRRDAANHDAECKRLTQLRSHVQNETDALINDRDTLWDGTDFWISSAGNREYCRMRARLAQKIENMTNTYEVAPLVEQVLAHRLEILRVDVKDHLGLREIVPFTLLRLNQDDRCVAFITHWMRHLFALGNMPDIDLPYVYTSIERLHKHSVAGEWLYGTADPYIDIFEAVRNAPPARVSIAYLMALCIVKLRVIARYEADCQNMTLFCTTRIGQLLGDNTELIESFVVGDLQRAMRVAEQARHVERYLDIIHERNCVLLPSIINPAPLMSCGPITHRTNGGASEAYFVHLSCRKLFASISGAMGRLEKRFGPRPQYDCNAVYHDGGLIYD